MLLASGLIGCSADRIAAVKAFQGTRTIRAPVAFHVIRDSPDITVLDLREPDEFHGEHGHINGAVNVPLGELHHLLDIAARLGRDRAVFVYCRDSPCAESGAALLREHGIRFIFVLEGGLPSWLDGGFGTVGKTAVDQGSCERHGALHGAAS